MILRLAGPLSLLLAAGTAVVLAPACGGTPKQETETPGESEGEEPSDDGGDQATDDGSDDGGERGAEGEGDEGTEGAEGADGAEGTEGTAEEGPPPAVTFVLKNSDSTELAFNMDFGWQPNLFAYTGKPPRAKSILMFPKFCTASCELEQEERCPVCEQPERAKDVLAAQKMERVAAGEELEVPWDGQIFAYEKTRGRRKTRCECHRTEPAPAGTYTVKACGLRLTQSAEERSKLQCVEGEMTLPADGPQRVELDFGKPQAAKKKKRR